MTTLDGAQPKVVLVELFPFGRAKFARELVPLLEERARIGASPPAACATSSSARARTSERTTTARAARQRAPGR